MRNNIFRIFALLVLSLWAALGCTKSDDALDSAQDGYGYIQFKLYKSASYEPTRAVVDQLEYLNDAKRLQVTLSYNSTTITQTVDLAAYDSSSAEYGLRSEKLRLLSGDYSVVGFNLFDIRDEVIYNSKSGEMSITVPDGGMEVYDLTVDAKERGKVRFSFIKDFISTRSEETSDTPQFMTTTKVKLSAVETSTSATVQFDNIPVDLYSRFNDEGMQSVYLSSSELLDIDAGAWRVNEYTLYNSSGGVIYVGKPETQSETIFEVKDNSVAEPEVKISIWENTNQIMDYIALKAIWDALDGENWSFQGQNYPKGANWDFNKDVDLWGYQPGVLLHPNGRVASINISEFGFSGDMPEELGLLTQLTELYLGTHNDINGDIFSSQIQGLAMNGLMTYEKRMELGREYIESRLGNPFEAALSPILRLAYTERGVAIPGGISVTDEQVEAQVRGEQSAPQMRADVGQGTYCNGLTSLPESMGNLQNLSTLFIANGMLRELPESFKNLSELTDLEIYNCQDMAEFPIVLAELPNLVALNISENSQWDAKSIHDGLTAMADSEPIQEYLQLLYANGNSLEELPASFNKLTKLALLDMTNNKISKVNPMSDVRPVQLFLDNNLITELPHNFCDTEDAESISFNYNLLEEFPNIFDKDDISIASVSFAYNRISRVEGQENEGEFNGINATSLNLSGNLFTEYPAIFATAGSIVGQMTLSNNQIETIPDEAFEGENVWMMESIDLSRNKIKSIPSTLNGKTLPYLYGVDFSYNQLDYVPFGPLNCSSLTIYIIRGQRDENGNRILKNWVDNLGLHTGLRGFFIGSNDIRTVNDTLSFMIYNLDIADNPNIVLDASSICPYIQMGAYALYYDKTQDIRNCSILGIQ